jgi:hypothetical protein
MCQRINGHFYCWRYHKGRNYLVHSCKGRKQKRHKKAPHWVSQNHKEVI